MREKYFDIERDKQFPCFCQACLTGKPENNRSTRDTRYCLECQPFIEEEYKIRGEKYIPVLNAVLDPTDTEPRESPIENQKRVLLHTKRDALHAYQNQGEDRPKPNVGGRPKKDIPIELIHTLSRRELSIKQIVLELKRKGQTISAMTISRVLSGERK